MRDYARFLLAEAEDINGEDTDTFRQLLQVPNAAFCCEVYRSPQLDKPAERATMGHDTICK